VIDGPLLMKRQRGGKRGEQLSLNWKLHDGRGRSPLYWHLREKKRNISTGTRLRGEVPIQLVVYKKKEAAMSVRDSQPNRMCLHGGGKKKKKATPQGSIKRKEKSPGPRKGKGGTPDAWKKSRHYLREKYLSTGQERGGGGGEGDPPTPASDTGGGEGRKKSFTT